MASDAVLPGLLFVFGLGFFAANLKVTADVLAAARAFSGWNRAGAEFHFNPDAHDTSRKTFLGKSGRFDGTDIVDILMQQPATPRFITAKLLRFFASPSPSDEVIAEAAEVFDRTQFNVKWFLRELFQSNYFFSTECYRTRISSPAEYVIGTVRALGVPFAPNTVPVSDGSRGHFCGGAAFSRAVSGGGVLGSG